MKEDVEYFPGFQIVRTESVFGPYQVYEPFWPVPSPAPKAEDPAAEDLESSK